MNIQKNTSYSQPFGLRLNINSRFAFYNGRSMLSKSELEALQLKAEKIGNKEDVVDLFIGSVTRLANADKNTFKESYILSGKALIQGMDSTFSLGQSWLKPAEKFEKFMPFDVIGKYLDTVETKLKIKKH